MAAAGSCYRTAGVLLDDDLGDIAPLALRFSGVPESGQVTEPSAVTAVGPGQSGRLGGLDVR